MIWVLRALLVAHAVVIVLLGVRQVDLEREDRRRARIEEVH